MRLFAFEFTRKTRSDFLVRHCYSASFFGWPSQDVHTTRLLWSHMASLIKYIDSFVINNHGSTRPRVACKICISKWNFEIPPVTLHFHNIYDIHHTQRLPITTSLSNLRRHTKLLRCRQPVLNDQHNSWNAIRSHVRKRWHMFRFPVANIYTTRSPTNFTALSPTR